MRLNKDETVILIDTIDQAIEGHVESKIAAMLDPVFVNAEEFVEHMQMIDINISKLSDIKGKVFEDDRG